MRILEVDAFPVKVKLHLKNPWGKELTVNGVTISTNTTIEIMSPEVLKKLLPIEKYIVFEEFGTITKVDKKKADDEKPHKVEINRPTELMDEVREEKENVKVEEKEKIEVKKSRKKKEKETT